MKSRQEPAYDILIAGAGPAGATAALILARKGFSIAVLEKATFPRDKICGDALSVDVVNQLSMISPALPASFQALSAKVESRGVRIISPDHGIVDLPFKHHGSHACGYISPRLAFDNLLVEHFISFQNISFIQDCELTDIEVAADHIKIETSKGSIVGKVIIGADGAQSLVGKKLTTEKMDRNHHSAGLRVYYENLRGFHEGNYIELYFLKNILPGYLWIFPLPGDRANVGIGMLSSRVSEKKINLKKTLTEILTTHELFKCRFENAKPMETTKGFGLPLGSKRRTISGNRFVLAGDAASLIDPFSGEGIANAIRSGRIAADHIAKCFQSNDFSASFNKEYDREVYRRMGNEFMISRSLQRLCMYPWLFNAVVRKANRNPAVHEALTDALSNVGKKKWLTRPSFYVQLFFR